MNKVLTNMGAGKPEKTLQLLGAPAGVIPGRLQEKRASLFSPVSSHQPFVFQRLSFGGTSIQNKEKSPDYLDFLKHMHRY